MQDQEDTPRIDPLLENEMKTSDGFSVAVAIFMFIGGPILLFLLTFKPS